MSWDDFGGVDSTGDYYQWCKANGMYIAQEEVISLFHTNNQHFLIIDTRDEDSAGGNIRGALHFPDGSDWLQTMPLLLAAIEKKEATMVIFHCMESIRRGPRCARRLHNYFLDTDIDEDDIPEVRILQGGADQWIRKFYKTDLVENYDDDYWAFEEFPPDVDGDEDGDDEKVETSDSRADANNIMFQSSCSGHTLYTRPTDQHINSQGGKC
jgi:rhodanese-related sulfurtransferase